MTPILYKADETEFTNNGLGKITGIIQKSAIVQNTLNGAYTFDFELAKNSRFKGLPATDIHHMQGREGYADEWARENEMPLLLDERFWLPVSREGHLKITADSKWASENGFTFLRVTDPVFRKVKAD